MKSLEFDAAAFDDLAWWIEQDRDKALKIVRLIKTVQRDPFRGPGKPEPLRHELGLLVMTHRPGTSAGLSSHA